MGRHHQTPPPGRKPSPRPRLRIPETLQDFVTWPMLALALAISLVLGVLLGVLIS